MASEAAIYDVLIVGAGVTGCTAARAFARQGRRVLVIEQNLRQPDYPITGELLQPGGVEGLVTLGLEQCLEDIDATAVCEFQLHYKGEQASLRFSREALPGTGAGKKQTDTSTGRSFRYASFVSKLRSAISADESVTVIEATASEILRDTTGRVIGIECFTDLHSRPRKHYADLVVLADGASSKFRSQFQPLSRPSSYSRSYSLVLRGPSLPRDDFTTVILGSEPPILICRVGENEMHIQIDLADESACWIDDEEAEVWHGLTQVLPDIPPQFLPSVRQALGSGRLRSVPNSWMPSARNTTPGLVILGDAANLRPLSTGASATVAIKDTILLAELLEPTRVPLANSGRVLRRLEFFHWKRKRYSAPLNILARVFYSLFYFDENEHMNMMQRDFIAFLQSGEDDFAAAGLVGGTVESPLLLARFFFRVALFSVLLRLRSSSILALPWTVFDALTMLYKVVRLVVPAVLDELRA